MTELFSKESISQRKRDQEGMSGMQYNHLTLEHSRFNFFSENMCVCVYLWSRVAKRRTRHKQVK